MTKEMKRPTSHISGNSIKPALSKAVEFYTDNNRQAYECIHERDEYIDYLESKLSNASPQQALPVVLQDVVDWVDNSREYYYEFEEWFDSNNQSDVIYQWLNCEDKRYADLNALALATLIVNGRDAVAIEKPQLFYIELPNVYGLKNKVSVSKVENGTIVEFSNGKNYALKFTEQEIKSIDPRYWAFRKEVEI